MLRDNRTQFVGQLFELLRRFLSTKYLTSMAYYPLTNRQEEISARGSSPDYNTMWQSSSETGTFICRRWRKHKAPKCPVLYIWTFNSVLRHTSLIQLHLMHGRGYPLMPHQLDLTTFYEPDCYSPYLQWDNAATREWGRHNSITKPTTAGRFAGRHSSFTRDSTCALIGH